MRIYTAVNVLGGGDVQCWHHLAPPFYTARLLRMQPHHFALKGYYVTSTFKCTELCAWIRLELRLDRCVWVLEGQNVTAIALFCECIAA